MDKNVGNLIDVIKRLISRRELDMIDDALFLRLLSKEFNFFNSDISSEQWHQIDLLIDRAAEMWSNLDDVPSDIMSYRSGFINAVLSFCRILRIDKSRVKK